MKNFCKEHGELLGFALLLALLPLVCCIVHCGLQGYSLLDVYLPSGEWNDELFYFKQVEGILEFGYPYGYFGFNESHAEKLSFAAWSPVLVIPWVIWGLIFGWNLLSPIWCNIFLMSTAIFLFVVFAKPKKQQMIVLSVLYCLFPMFTRYILSGMPEIICFSVVIVFYGLAVSYLKEEPTKSKLIWLFVLAACMTLMRPYLLLMMFLPALFWIQRSRKWWSIVGSLAIMLGCFGAYAWIHTQLGAEYLEPLFSVDWLTVMLEEGFFKGLKFVLYTMTDKGMQFMRASVEAFVSGYSYGIFFAVFMVAFVLLTIQLIQSIRQKDKTEGIIFGHAVFSFLGMLGALLLMYLLHDGKRHLMTFVAVAIFLISIAKTKYYVKAVILGLVCMYLFTIKADSPMDFQVPFASEERVEWMQYWEDTFQEEMSIDHINVPNYNNSVIWVLTDSQKENPPVPTEWQALYAIPKGMGISCSSSEYVNTNIDRLKCRYIVTLSEGTVDENCKQNGFVEIGRKGNVVAYKVR